ncbi:MAG: class II glutamine amidotransferase [Oscillospiraceae bacterium]|nr:class II glutamine amidotransferase [Oscillospiraceae bacterium]
MCELLGVFTRTTIPVNDLLREFVSHSTDHPNGWGLAFFHGDSVSLEKEPVMALKSAYLRERLRRPISTSAMVAHIRLATRGTVDYENCHPFVGRDSGGRTWTLLHNGTVFEAPELDRYVHTQEGHTDSERILCHLLSQVNQEQTLSGVPLTTQQRFALLERLTERLSRRSKLNLMIYDGELLYTHTNYAASLYQAQVETGRVFATTPLGRLDWQPLPMNTLCAWRQGEPVFQGKPHKYEYLDNEEDMRLLFLDYAVL